MLLPYAVATCCCDMLLPYAVAVCCCHDTERPLVLCCLGPCMLQGCGLTLHCKIFDHDQDHGLSCAFLTMLAGNLGILLT